MRPCIRAHAAVKRSHPWRHPPIVEPRPQQASHFHTAGQAFNHPHDYRFAIMPRHEVGDADRAALGRVISLQDQCVAAIASFNCGYVTCWCDLPAAIGLITQHRRKARIAVEARTAEEIDGPVDGDHRCRASIADEGIVRDL